MDAGLRDAFRAREMRVERTVNLCRLGVAVSLMTADLTGLVSAGTLTPGFEWLFAAIIAGFFLYSWAVHRLASGPWRPWLKFVTIAVDFALIASVSILYDDLKFHFGFSQEGFLGLLLATIVLFTFLSALRSGAPVIGYSAALGIATFTLLSTGRDVAPLMPVYGAIMIALAGAIAYSVSWGVTSMFVRLRRRDGLARFLAKELVDRIDAGELTLAPGGRTQTVTVLFSDIRGFTSMSEGMPPADVVSLLNEYLEQMTRVVFAHRGTVDKFVGDAVMAVFGTPESGPDDASRAIRAATAMLEALEELNARWRASGRPQLSIGIGLHTGPAVAGLIGSPERLEYTVIGDTVNVASRIEGMNKQFGTRLLMSEAVWNAAGAGSGARFVAETDVRGRHEKVRVYTLEPPAAVTAS